MSFNQERKGMIQKTNSNSSKLRTFVNSISKDNTTGTGMAMVLILLFCYNYYGNILLLKLAIAGLLINMTFPKLFYPFAVVWFGLANILSQVVPKILLSLVYIFLVFPLGYTRRLFGYDSLKLKLWKKDNASVMSSRDYIYTSSDLEKPY
jgi:hypothetical protein